MNMPTKTWACHPATRPEGESQGASPAGWRLHRPGAGPRPPPEVLYRTQEKIDRLILLTSESSLHPVDFDDRTKMLHNANRRVPTHARVVDPHDAVTVRTVVDPLLKGGCHDCSFSVVLITTTECAVNGED